MSSKQMSFYKASLVIALTVGAATPGGAQDIGEVGGLPADVLDVEVLDVGAYEGFGDIAYLCPLGNGCLSDFGGHIVRLDGEVWDDLGIDTGDAFPDETNVTVRHTFFGHVIALAPPSPTDIVCFSVPLTDSFTATTRRRCAKIVPAPAGATPDLGALKVERDTTSFCEEGIAYVIRMDTTPPSEGFEDGVRIGVCDGFNWLSADPANFKADADGVDMAATMPLAVARTPGTTYNRSAYR